MIFKTARKAYLKALMRGDITPTEYQRRIRAVERAEARDPHERRKARREYERNWRTERLRQQLKQSLEQSQC